jgi:hypothetical protein
MNIMTSPFHATWACMRLSRDIWQSQIKLAQALMMAPLEIAMQGNRSAASGAAVAEPVPAARKARVQPAKPVKPSVKGRAKPVALVAAPRAGRRRAPSMPPPLPGTSGPH